METLAGRTFRFHDFELDVSKRLLLKSGSPVTLKPRAFDVLLALVESRGQLVSKDELLERVWPGQFVEEGNLKVHISALRKIFGEGRNEHRFIVTVPGRGYSFVADLNGDSAGEVVVETHNLSRITIDQRLVQADAAPVRRSQRFVPLALALLALGCLAVIGGYLAWPGRSAMSAADFEIRQLTTHGKIASAALSPDGKLFAFTLGTTGNPMSLWVGHTAGGEPIELRPPTVNVWYQDLRFSPDASQLYFVASDRGTGGTTLFRMPVLGGIPEKMRDGVRGGLSFSPDMTQIAFVRNDAKNGESRLVASATEGGDDRVLASRPIKASFIVPTVAWSPDGRVIAVGATNGDEGDNDCELLTVDVGNGQTKEVSTRRFSSILAISWMSDAESLLITAIEPPRWDSQIFTVSYPDGDVRPFTSDLQSYSESLDVSTDGRKVLALQKNTIANLWIAPSDDLGGARQATLGSLNGRAGTHGLEWLPNGQILFPAFSDRTQPLWVVNADGTSPKRITPESGVDQQPGVSADGRIIVFTSNRSGAAEIWRMDGTGENLTQLTSGGRNDMPTISPDGKWVVYISNRDGLATIWRISADGGEPVRLADHYASWPRISPDSRFVVCAFTAGGKPQLLVVPIEGGPPVKVFDAARTANFRFGLRWTPDGQAIAYRDWTSGYWLQHLDGNPPERMKGLPNEKLFSFAWSPDGKQFVFSRGTETRDVVLFSHGGK